MATLAQSLGSLVRKGVGAIPGVDLPSEKRKRVMSQAFSDFEKDIAGGMDAGNAQIKALSRAAAGFASEGMTQQANELRLKLVQLVQSEETRVAQLSKMKAQTGLAEAQTSALLSPDAEDVGIINMVKLPDPEVGGKPEFAAVSENNPERAQELIDQGFLEMSAVSLGATAGTLGEAAGGKVAERQTQEDLLGQLSLLGGLRVLKDGAANTGLLEGPVRGFAAHFGMALPGEEGASAVDMLSVRRKMRADVQSIIKGIPSNYDAGVYERTIPNPFAFAFQPLFDSQVDLLEQETKALVSGTIAFYKGTDKEIPKLVVQAAANLGVNIDSIRPWDGQGDPLGQAIQMQGTRSEIGKALESGGAINNSFNPMQASPEEVDAAINRLPDTLN